MNNLGDSQQACGALNQLISREIAKFCKTQNGKGPDSIEIRMQEDVLVCFFEGFMTKAEELIVQSGHPENVCNNRVIFMNNCTAELEEILHKFLHKKIKYLFPCYLPERQMACWTIYLY